MPKIKLPKIKLPRIKFSPIKIKLPKALGGEQTIKAQKPKRLIRYKPSPPTKKEIKQKEKAQKQKADQARELKRLNQAYKRAEKRSAKATAEYNRLMRNAKNRERYAAKKEQEKKRSKPAASRRLTKEEKKQLQKREERNARRREKYAQQKQLTAAEKKRAREIIKELEEDQKPRRGKKEKQKKDSFGGAPFYDGVKDLREEHRVFKVASYPMSNARDAVTWWKKAGAGKSYFAILKAPNKRTGTNYYYVVDIDPNRTRAGSKQKVNKYASHRAEQIYQKFLDNSKG